jgi:hypothetical protein
MESLRLDGTWVAELDSVHGYQKFTCCRMEPINARPVSHLCDEPAIPEVAKSELPT